MIITKLAGGLGNQLFQYAAGRRLAYIRETGLKIDAISLGQHDTARVFALDHFHIKASIATPEEIEGVSVIDTDKKKRKAWNADHILGKNKLFFAREKAIHFERRILDLPDNTYLQGHWQSEKYFKDIRDVLLKDLTVNTPQQGKNLETAEKIKITNAVSLHIRRQDYVQKKHMASIYDVCTPEYYASAVAHIAKHVEKPHFFIFSDDIVWAKENMKLDFPTTYVDWNGDLAHFEDLRLMNQCKHNIIANSTFSWWGAWLNQNPEKIVIAPKRWLGIKWYGFTKWNTKDIVPETWLKM